MNHNEFYQIGKRDAIAETFMNIRLNGESAALCELANQLINSDAKNPNPHAKWYLENQKSNND